jgi:hypothetical protein
MRSAPGRSGHARCARSCRPLLASARATLAALAHVARPACAGPLGPRSLRSLMSTAPGLAGPLGPRSLRSLMRSAPGLRPGRSGHARCARSCQHVRHVGRSAIRLRRRPGSQPRAVSSAAWYGSVRRSTTAACSAPNRSPPAMPSARCSRLRTMIVRSSSSTRPGPALRELPGALEVGLVAEHRPPTARRPPWPRDATVSTIGGPPRGGPLGAGVVHAHREVEHPLEVAPGLGRTRAGPPC